MSLDDALALAERMLADYDASDAVDSAGPELLWRDQLAHALRELAAAASTWHVTPVGDRPIAAVVTCRERPDRIRNWVARMARAGRAAARAPERGAVVLSAMDADTVWQALADAGAWHGVYGDCAVCVVGGVCGERERHEVIAVQYAALRSWLESETR
jgi:hypothetical protein